jgi:zinc protease
MTLIDQHPFGPRLVVEKHRLTNGLTVLLLPDRSAPVLAYQTWLRVGSRHERPGRTGIAHLFEHLMFNQSENLAAGEFDRRMEALGGDSNAATWVDWTFYRDSAPAAALPLVLDLEVERLSRLVLEHDQVEAEREVVLNERRQRVDDDVEGFLAEELYRLAFTRHGYHHPTIGWEADIQAISIADARAFYETFYAPNNATLVLVGDFEPAAALDLIARTYGELLPAKIGAGPSQPEPAQGGERRARFAKPVLADRVVFAYKAPAQGDPDWIPLVVLNELLVGGPSARLHRELVITREATTGVSGSVAPFAEPGLWELFVPMKRGQPASVAEEALDAAAALLARVPVGATELTKVKNRLETEHWAELETADGKAEALGNHETSGGDHRRLFDYARRVEAVTAEDVLRVARTYMVPDARTVVVAEPSGEEGDE